MLAVLKKEFNGLTIPEQEKGKFLYPLVGLLSDDRAICS